MLQTSRSLLYRTATALGWAGDPVRPGGAPLPQTLSAITASAVTDGQSAGIALGYCLPIKCPAASGFGQANLETDAAVHGGTLFRIGSCTRQFTAAAILMLAERGTLKLTDPVHSILPDTPDLGEATLRDLLADASNDAGYALLGAIVTQVSGAPYADFITAHLLIPAGMTASLFHDSTRIVPNRASGYALRDGSAGDFCHAMPAAAEAPIAAAGLHSTASDLMLWNRALYSGRLISRDSLDRMTTTPIVHNDHVHPALASFTSRAGHGYGLAVGRLCGRRAFWHIGRTSGFDAWLFHFPDDRADLALLANTDDGAAAIIEPIVRALLRV